MHTPYTCPMLATWHRRDTIIAYTVILKIIMIESWGCIMGDWGSRAQSQGCLECLMHKKFFFGVGHRELSSQLVTLKSKIFTLRSVNLASSDLAYNLQSLQMGNIIFFSFPIKDFELLTIFYLHKG